MGRTHLIDRVVDMDLLRKTLLELCGDESQNVMLLDGYDDAIVGITEQCNGTLPRIVYDYDLMQTIAYEREKTHPSNDGRTEDEIISCVTDSINDKGRLIEFLERQPGKSAPLIMSSTFVRTK